jgi:uncharacterized LabA/DUF88 family protein
MAIAEERLEKRRAYYRANREKVRAQNNRWNQKNRERKLAQAREYAAKKRADPLVQEYQKLKNKEYWADPKKRKECQAKLKQWHLDHPEYNRQYLRRRIGRDPLKYMLASAKKRAIGKGIPFDIEYTDLVLPTHCPVLGIKLEADTARGRNNSSPSLDRKIPNLGYVKGNVEVISMRANWLKSNGTADELRRVAAYAARCEDN